MYVLENILGFIAHPKTASVATQAALRTIGAVSIGNHHEVDVHLCQRILDAGGVILSTIRNPFDLLLSWYFHGRKRNNALTTKPFTEWLREFLRNPNHYVRQGLFFGLPWTNRVLRFETLQQDFDAVIREFTGNPLRIAPANVSEERAGRPYQEFYDDGTRRLIEDHFGAELQEHGYVF